MKTVFRALALALLLTGMSWGQSCLTATCTAASVAESDVLAALPSNSNTNSTVVVNIPAGTGNWTSPLSYTIPSGVTNLKIQGQTTINWTGTPGASSWAYTLTDSTLINDNLASNTPLITITTGASSTYFTWSGISIQGGTAGTGNQKYNGLLVINGNSKNVRIGPSDHFNNTTYSPAIESSWVRLTGQVTGVSDHSVWDLGTNASTTNGIQVFNDLDDTVGNGDGGFKSAAQWGTSNFFFIENSYFNGGAPDDCAEAGRFVMRYSTLKEAYVAIQTHGTKSSGGPGRGCREYEAYHNYIWRSSGAYTGDGAVGSKNSTALIWGNTMPQGYYRFGVFCTDRNNCESPETATPNGWGYAGTAGGTRTGSNWDANTNTSTGYPDLDGIGRGQQSDSMNGANFPSRLNVTAGNIIAWPHQMLEPVYMFNNTVTPGAGTLFDIRDNVTVSNRDIFGDCGAYNSTCATFNGTVGTGSGLRSARPSTCTAGAGGTYATSPTGSYGVAYWETDNQQLDICTATNVWTDAVYKPYSYPHPLTATVTTYTFTPGIIPLGSGTITGLNSAAGTYAANTTIGPLTAVPAPGYGFTGWTGASGSAIGVCGGISATQATSFQLNANSNCVANFNGLSYLLSLSVTPNAAGSINNCAGYHNYNTAFTCNIVANAGYTLQSVTGCGGSLSGLVYSGVMTGNCTVAATFASPTCGDPTQLSPNFSGSYPVPPTVTPITVGFVSPTSGCGMHYTLDGSAPTCASTVYPLGNFSISSLTTIRVIACQTGYNSSQVVGGTWSFPSSVVTNPPSNLIMSVVH